MDTQAITAVSCLTVSAEDVGICLCLCSSETLHLRSGSGLTLKSKMLCGQMQAQLPLSLWFVNAQQTREWLFLCPAIDVKCILSLSSDCTHEEACPSALVTCLPQVSA